MYAIALVVASLPIVMASEVSTIDFGSLMLVQFAALGVAFSIGYVLYTTYLAATDVHRGVAEIKEKLANYQLENSKLLSEVVVGTRALVTYFNNIEQARGEAVKAQQQAVTQQQVAAQQQQAAIQQQQQTAGKQKVAETPSLQQIAKANESRE